MQVRLVSVQTETPEGGVDVRIGEQESGSSGGGAVEVALDGKRSCGGAAR